MSFDDNYLDLQAVSDTGQVLTLRQCLLLQIGQWGSVSSEDGSEVFGQRIFVNEIVEGPFLDYSTQVVLSASANITDLPSWVPTPTWFERTEDEAGRKTAIAHEPLDLVSLPLSRGVTLRLKAGTNSSISPLENTWRLSVWAIVTSVRPRPLEYFKEQIEWLRVLLCLCLNRITTVEHLSITVSGGDSPDRRQMYHQPTSTDGGRWLHPSRIPFRPKTTVSTAKILKSWYRQRKSLEESANLLLTVWGVREMHQEFKLLALTQALEAFHRRVFLEDSYYMEQQEYQDVYSIVARAIPTGLSPEHRDSLKARLKFGNEVSQRHRMKHLVRQLPSGVTSALPFDWKKWADHVVDSRNDLTHYPVGARDRRTNDLITNVCRLGVMTHALLLGRAGFSDHEVAAGLLRTSDWLQSSKPLADESKVAGQPACAPDKPLPSRSLHRPRRFTSG